MNLNLSREIDAAASLIAPFARETPLQYSPALSDQLQGEVFLKLENYQVTGSFKARGALNKILSIRADDDRRVVTASTGNHAGGVCYALQKTGREGVIFLPETVSETKVSALRSFENVKLEFFGQDSVDAEVQARTYSTENDLIFVSPYNDPEIIAGQGTIGREILEQMEGPLDAVFVPVGGGGLIAGIASYVHFNSETKVVGCQPMNSAVMHASVQAGRILDLPSKPTMSDGTAGGVEMDAITFPFCQKLVQDWIEVSEEELMLAMREIIIGHQMMIEGAAALALASLMKQKERFQGKRVCLILCGNKISEELLVKVVNP